MPGELTNAELSRLFESHGLISRSAVMLPILRQAHKAALVSDVTVLLEGETGTGKQVLAQAIHQLDEKRKSFAFITVHCSTVSDGLAESELFGHERGAFSGAVRDRDGLFQAAQGGTLFLDDVNDLPQPLQPKLLDVLQRRVVRRVGSDRETRVNARVIAAANQPLAQAVEQGRFRRDLYHRLNVVRLCLPPLRERPGDLPELVLALARRYRALYGPILEIETGLISFLRMQTFSGNIRELENSVQRVLFGKSHGTTLNLEDWQRQSTEESAENHADLAAVAARNLWEVIAPRGLPFVQSLRQIERLIIETALQGNGLTRREIAKRLRTSERTLYHKIRAYGLSHHDNA